MHVHILGVCGTFMGGVAALARAAGHRVTGSDKNVYPPMSTQLEALGIELIQGYDPAQLYGPSGQAPDIVIVGNVMSRGHPVVEALLNRGLPFTSGPQWLAENVLRDRWVLAVTGTHGKTTTSSMLTWILEHAGLDPGFLIGGVPGNFGTTARLGSAPFFVIEADEYDTAFFDKRSKFVHLRPRTVILNNMEFDHADIFENLAAIQKQFHLLMRVTPGDGLIVHNAADRNLDAMLQMGCWTPRQGFSGPGYVGNRAGSHADGGVVSGAADIASSVGAPKWTARITAEDYSSFDVLEDGVARATVKWSLLGAHNVDNAMAAIAAAHHAGVTVPMAAEALSKFSGVKRRLELRGTVNNIAVYDDFAHHPTAITLTVDGLRKRVGKARIIAVLEPRSNTMKMGVHNATLANSLSGADDVWFYAPPDLGWDLPSAIGSLGSKAHVATDLAELERGLVQSARPGDHVLIMSNGGFGGLHTKLLTALGVRKS